MKIKKSVSIIVASAVMLSSLFTLSGCGKKVPSTVLGANGEKLAEITSSVSGKSTYTSEKYSAYIDFVIEDAAEALSLALNVSKEDAAKLLWSEGYTVSTLFENEAMEALVKARQEGALSEDALFGAAALNLSGGVMAVYSSGEYNGITNFALAKSQPYSALKPLSVYTPALEAGLIDWATPTLDTPFKKVEDERGNLTDWPTNASGRYTNKNISIGDAIRDSVNTVSVHTLDKLGAKKSLDFLNKSFGLETEAERDKMKSSGAEEIYGNLAMGYLIEGISPVDMAGYYSIFANGGKYTKPYTVTKITDKDGKEIYKAKPKANQVISEQTAYIINRMLNTVVTRGGTGKKAQVSGVDICGKTGTGTTNLLKGNWFSGFTPQYSMAVWHGGREGSNIAAELFKIFVENMNNDKSLYFKPVSKVIKKAFCTQSGGLYAAGCSGISEGYFLKDNLPEKCEGHSR